MYHVFVVEDELLIRQSIRSMIESMPGPYAFCGEASDGEMALSMMQDMMPDILLTDIRMPFLDGFGLIRQLKVMMPWLKIVIISGYGDFEYAQKAIDLGVDRYLLKPVRSADLIRTVEEMASKLEAERQSVVMPGGFDRDEAQTALKQSFMRQLLHGSGDVETLLERARALGIDLMHPIYQVVSFGFDPEGGDPQSAEQAINALAAQSGIQLYYIHDQERMTVLFSGNDPEQINEKIYRFNNILRHQLKEISPEVTTVIGNAVRRLSSVGESYRAVTDLMRKAGGAFVGRVVDINDTASIMAEIVGSGDPFGDDFRKKLQYAVADDVPELAGEILEGPDSDRYGSMMMRYQTLVDLLRLSVGMVSRIANPDRQKEIAEQLSREYDILAASRTKDSFRQMLETLMLRIISMRQENVNDQKYRHVIGEAERYIAQHYCDPNISLVSTAKEVAMSPAHFSTVFSQTTGRSFITYLTAMRIERAKQLLETTDQKLGEIAMEIGYNEPNYFSHVFRKTEGITPKEYRSLHGR